MCKLLMCPECEQFSDHPHPIFKHKKPDLMGKRGKNREKTDVLEENATNEAALMEKRLKDMGFKDENENKKALRMSRYNIDEAVQKLLFQ